MAKKKVPVVEGDKITIPPPKLHPPIQASTPPEYEILKSIHQIDEKNTEQQRKQDRKNTYLMGFSIFFAAASVVLGYFTLVATWQANAANQAAADATSKQVQLELKVSQISSQLSAYQSKNDSLNTIVESMKAVLKKHGIDVEK